MRYSDAPVRYIRFLVTFIGVYTLLEAAYFAVPNEFLANVVYHYGVVATSVDIIHLVTPREPVVAGSNILQSGSTALEIVRGCDGAGVTFLLISAILALPASMARKIAGSVAAVGLVFMLNQARVVGLFYIGAYKKSWFIPVHVYLAPTLMIVVCCIFFAWWIPAGRSAIHGPA